MRGVQRTLCGPVPPYTRRVTPATAESVASPEAEEVNEQPLDVYPYALTKRKIDLGIR